MNKKGFMMAEVVIVSAIVLVAIIGLYTTYNKIYTSYNTRLDYYDVTTLYRLGYYRDILIENNILNAALNEIPNENNVIDIYTTGAINNKFVLPDDDSPDYLTDSVYLVHTKKSSKISGKKEINSNILDTKEVNLTFKDYLTFLSKSATFESDYLMLMERCSKNNDSELNINNCKYAYLEVYTEKG